MIINDSKGELHNRLAAELEAKGYHIVVINFRNPAVGNAWNPLYIPYKFYINGDIDRASEFANDIANNLMVSERSSDDPFWDYSASDLLFGLILLLFRYCKDHNSPVSSVNIANLLELRRSLFASKAQAKNSILWKYASEDELVAASLSGSIYAPNDTMNSINSGTSPLYILDGVAIASSDFNTINPADIESISVLKDASSTSISVSYTHLDVYKRQEHVPYGVPGQRLRLFE